MHVTFSRERHLMADVKYDISLVLFYSPEGRIRNIRCIVGWDN